MVIILRLLIGFLERYEIGGPADGLSLIPTVILTAVVIVIAVGGLFLIYNVYNKLKKERKISNVDIAKQLSEGYFESTDYVNSINEIDGEEVLYVFRECLPVRKETNSITKWIPREFVFILLIGVCYCLINGYPLITAFFVSIAYVIVSRIIPNMLIADSKDYKESTYLWAISEHYFVQILQGAIEVKIKKEDVNYIDYNGYEIIMDLDTPQCLARNKSMRDKLVLDNVEDAEYTYQTLKEWLKK